MARIQPVDRQTATGKTKELLDGVAKSMGGVPNLIATFAQSPAALEFFLAASKALSGSTIPARVREQIDLAVSQQNGCDYCLAAHTQLAKAHRLSDTQILEARRGHSDDPRTAAILTFATKVNQNKGHLTDSDFAEGRSAGVTDGELADIIAAVALKVFTNDFAIATQVEVDFPPAPALVG